MLLTEATAKDVVVFQLPPVLTADDLLAIKQEVLARLRECDRIGLVMDMTSLEDMTADAMAEDLKLGLELFEQLQRIPRVAVISDKQWYRALVDLAVPFVPSMKIEVISPQVPHAMDKAMKFASDLGEVTPSEDSSPSIVQLTTDRPDLLAFEYHGKINVDDLDIALKPLTEAFSTNDKIDLFVRLDELTGFDPRLLMQKSLISLKFAALKQIRRYAIVGANSWIKRLIETFQPMVAVDIRVFSADQEEAAWEWLNL